jgi:hypothetical protein
VHVVLKCGIDYWNSVHEDWNSGNEDLNSSTYDHNESDGSYSR